MNQIARYTQKLACYLRNTRAVSALEYALVIGIMAVTIFGAYQAFKNDITAAMTDLGRQIGGANQDG